MGMDTIIILFAKRGVISGREMCENVYTIVFNEISYYNDFSVF